MNFELKGKTGMVIGVVIVAFILWGIIDPEVFAWFFGVLFSLSRG